MKIDKIYVLNLEYRTDRKAEIIKELKEKNIKNFEIFKGIIPNEQILNRWNSYFLNPPPHWFKGNLQKYKIGALGCLLSHYTIIQKAYDLGYNNILIFEDDTTFLNRNIDFNTLLNKYNIILDNIDFGIFYLSGNNARDKLKNIINNIYLTEFTYTTGSYIINRKAMKYVLDNIKGYSKEIDVFYVEHIQKHFNCFVCHPPECIQRESYSDITHENSKYDLLNLK